MLDKPSIKSSVTEDAIRAIRTFMKEHALSEGSRLPSERVLAQQLHMSRRAIRNALEQLQDDGVVIRRPRSGTVVGPGASWLAHHADMSIKSLTSPRGLMEARLAFEPAAAAIAVLHATTEDIERLERCFRRSAAARSAYEWDYWDGQFHYSIGHATHNHLIKAVFAMLKSARMHTQWGSLREVSLGGEQQAQHVAQHRAIIDGIRQRDVQGTEARMRAHLLAVQDGLLPVNHAALAVGTGKTGQ